MSRVAIIGAGIGGVVLGQALAGRHDVVVFEKGRGVGGRMATRQAPGFAFDHGAQFFTARDPRFVALVEQAMAAGAVGEWTAPIASLGADGRLSLASPREPHYVGMPGMNSFVRALAGDVTIRSGVDLAPLTARGDDGWQLTDVAGTALGVFDWVISSTVPHQTRALFAGTGSDADALDGVVMLPCYALLLGFDAPLRQDWGMVRLDSGPLALVVNNASKPGRDARVGTLVAHSSSAWAEGQLDADPVLTEAGMVAALRDGLDIDASAASFRALHRWKSARLEGEANYPPFIDRQRGLAATGDWTTGSRVENVALSALELAGMVG
jgi:hypothetical protein